MKRILCKSTLVLALLTCGLISCSGNILKEFAKTDTDEALLIEAKIHMNNSEWAQAIATFGKMSTAFAARREIKLQEAKAYAGSCGVDLLSMADSLSKNLGTGRMLNILMGAMVGSTQAQADDCITAESLITGIAGNAANRTTEENTTVAFIAFGKVGAILAAFADDADGNATVDADFNGCDSTAAVGIPDNYVAQVGTGITIGSSSLTEALVNGGNAGSNELSSLTGACTNMSGNYSSNDFCSITDASTFSAAAILGIRFMINDDQTMGVGGLKACNLGVAPPTSGYCICP